MSFSLSYAAGFCMIALAVGFLVFIYRKAGTLLPADVAERLGSLLAMALVVTAALLLFVTFRVDSGGVFVESMAPRLMEAELDAPAPDFAFVRMDSEEEARLVDYRGAVVLVNWWATWCAPCLKELPVLNELQDKYAEAGLTVLTISDESRATLLDFQKDVPLRTVAGYVESGESLPDPFRRTLQMRPTSYVIDREGMIREFVLGEQDLPAFERMVAPWLSRVGGGE